MKKLLLITAAVLALTSQTNVLAADSTTTHDTLGQMVDDAAIVTIVNADLVKDSELSALKINVDSTQGQVVLKGTAPNPMAKERAETIAKDVKGVVSVDNRLMVAESTNANVNHGNMNSNADMNSNSNMNGMNSAGNEKMNNHTSNNMNNHTNDNMNGMSNNRMDDASINMAVNAALVGDSDLSALKINVHVNNGKVVLKGTAPSWAAKNHATEVAKNIDGVTSVHNELMVNRK